MLSSIFALLFNSNRPACIRMIEERGYDEYAAHMAAEGRQSLPR